MTLAPILVQVMTLVPNYDIMIVSSSKLILYGLANQLHSHLLITGMIAVCEVGLSVTNRIEKQDFRMLRFNIEIFLTNFYYPRLFDETLLENSNFEGCLS